MGASQHIPSEPLPSLGHISNSNRGILCSVPRRALERAKSGGLRSAPVITRATQNSFLDPKDVTDCKSLENLMAADAQAIKDFKSPSKEVIDELRQSGIDANTLSKKERVVKSIPKRISGQIEALEAESAAKNCPA